MTERKPMGIAWTSWIDRQVSDARERGEFDNLSGRGEPLARDQRSYDPDWWIKDKLRREDLEITPDTIVARRKVERWLVKYLNISHVDMVIHQAKQLNTEIIAANKTHLGPMSPQPLLDIDTLVNEYLKS